MSEINITVEGGTSKRLLTAGKYCDRDIVVTATGGGGGDVPETCTVKFDNESMDGMSPFICVTATVFENGSQKPYIFNDRNGVYSLVVPNVVCGSVMSIISNMYSNGDPYVEIDGSASLVASYALFGPAQSGDLQIASSVFIAPSVAGEECTIYNACA